MVVAQMRRPEVDENRAKHGGGHPDNCQVVVLGAGLAGLAATMGMPSVPVTLVEREPTVGGKASTHRSNGYIFDVTGHWMHFRDLAVRSFVRGLLDGHDLIEIGRRATVWTNGVMVPYPFQANIHALPWPVRQRCLTGFIGARARQIGRASTAPVSFEEVVIRHFGGPMARHFFLPYYSKFWGCSLDRLTVDWLERYFPMPTSAQVVSGALGFRQDRVGYNARFFYPAAGGIDVL